MAKSEIDYVDTTFNNDKLKQSNTFPTTLMRHNKARGTRQDIVWNALCLTIPMLLLTLALLVLIFLYRIDVEAAPYPTLEGNSTASTTSDAYYVNRSSTLVIFIASWMSSLAPMMSGFAISLAAYPIAGRLLDDTLQQHKDKLLTPFQLSLTMKLLNGSSWSALWSMLLYRIGWGKRVIRQGAALRALFKVTLAVLSLSILVFCADTWLHVTTKTVNLVRTSVVPPIEADYSMSLIPNCTTTNNTFIALHAEDLICIIDMETLVADASAAIQTLNNRSDTINVLTDGPDPAVAYLSRPPSKLNPQHDFTATTIGLYTQCKPITLECHINDTAQSVSYNCSRAEGSFAQDSNDANAKAVNQMFFSNPEMGANFRYPQNNSFYYGITAAITLSSLAKLSVSTDPEIVAMDDWVFVVLFCEVSFSDIEYDRVQGEIKRFVTTPTNASVPNAFLNGMTSLFGQSYLQNAIEEAMIMATDSQDLADQFALSLRGTVLSLAAASVMATPALIAQNRTSILVAKVPQAPLYLLILTNLSFVLMGIGLSIIAAMTSTEAHEVQGRLSIEGLVANMFEGERAKRPTEDVQRLFGEYWEGDDGQVTRVGIERTAIGGYTFKAIGGEENDTMYDNKI